MCQDSLVNSVIELAAPHMHDASAVLSAMVQIRDVVLSHTPAPFKAQHGVQNCTLM